MSTQQDRQGLGAASSSVGAQVTVVDRRALAPAGPGCAYRGQRCTRTLYDACTTGVWCAWGIHASADNELVASCYFFTRMEIDDNILGRSGSATCGVHASAPSWASRPAVAAWRWAPRRSQHPLPPMHPGVPARSRSALRHGIRHYTQALEHEMGPIVTAFRSIAERRSPNV